MLLRRLPPPLILSDASFDIGADRSAGWVNALKNAAINSLIDGLLYIFFLQPRSRLKKFLAMLFGTTIGVVISLVVIADKVGSLQVKNVIADRSQRAAYAQSHEHVPRKIFHCVGKKHLSGRTIFDVLNGMDEFDRRFTPPSPSKDASTRFVLFFGCSFVFGYGLADEDTLPAQFEKIAPNCQAYNYAKCGDCPSDMLYSLNTHDFSTEVSGRDGVLVYVFIPDHSRRVADARRLKDRQLPFYFLTAAGTVALAANAVERVRPANCTMWGNCRELTAQLIIESARTFRSRFGSPSFVTVFYPGSGRDAGMIIPALEKAGIRCLDYSHLFSAFSNWATIDSLTDPHPSAQAIRVVAARLAADLRQMGLISLFEPVTRGSPRGWTDAHDDGAASSLAPRLRSRSELSFCARNSRNSDRAATRCSPKAAGSAAIAR